MSTFRETEYKALKQQAADRSAAKERKREEESGSTDMFGGIDAAVQSAGIDDFVAAEKVDAERFLLELLADGPQVFGDVWVELLQRFVLRETNIKDICAALASTGRIEKTWGGGNRKPSDTDFIRLK